MFYIINILHLICMHMTCVTSVTRLLCISNPSGYRPRYRSIDHLLSPLMNYISKDISDDISKDISEDTTKITCCLL